MEALARAEAPLALVPLPDPRLHQVSREVRPDEFGDDLERHMRAMVDTMHAERGVGLAGVQVGDMRRVLVAVLDGEVVLMVNPAITQRSKVTQSDREGCLSVPGRVALRSRSRQVTVEYQDPQGGFASRTVRGFSARVVQHEVDHLDGKTI